MRTTPGGNLGRSLTPVVDLMRTKDHLPLLRLPASLRQTVAVMGATPGRPGCALIVDENDHLLGLFTDGDLRRLVAEERAALDQGIEDLMTREPLHLSPSDRALDAEAVLVTRAIDQAPVLDETGKLVGLIDIQDLHGDIKNA